MSHDLHRLVYLSRNVIAPERLSVEIDAILAGARRFNEASGVTGALMFNAGRFAQVLEGPRQALETTFERIQCDARHEDAVILQFEPVEARGFPNWSMAYVGDAAEAGGLFDRIAEDSGFDRRRMVGEAIFEILFDNMAPNGSRALA